jgi:protein gp37
MATDSFIAWTRHTLNIWWGCVEVSPLCDNCYAREWAKRYDRAKWGADEPRLFIKSGWTDVLKWQRVAAAAGEVHNVFCGSMMDIFEKPMPVVDGKGEDMHITTETLRCRLFLEVVPRCPNLLFLLLTKRPANIPKYVPPAWLDNPPANVMYGTSPGTQSTADQLVRQIRHVPGRRFLSIEPLLEPVGLGDGLADIDWTIIGCESLGGRAGRFQDGYEDAARWIKGQCAGWGVPFFHKQMPIRGRVSHKPEEWPADLRVRDLPAAAVVAPAARA